MTNEDRKITAVLKFGGDVVADADQLIAITEQIAELARSGWQFVLCHGGNPQANALAERLHIQRKQVGGRRITDAETLQVMKDVLAGECSIDVVAAAEAAGLNAVGISGVSAGTVTATKRPPKVFSGCGPDPIDFGYVGDIVRIRPDLIQLLLREGYTPVMNTLGVEEAKGDHHPCQVFNINADTVASALAAELKAEHLFFVTAVPGVLRNADDPGSRIPRLTEKEARKAIADGDVKGGMIVKLEEALRNLQRGIGAIHILGPSQDGVIAEAREPGSRGTVLTLQ
jgi:acetylglutamate kinase